MHLAFHVVLFRRVAEPMVCCDRFVVVPVNSFQSFSFDLTVRFPRDEHALDRQRFKTKKKNPFSGERGRAPEASALCPTLAQVATEPTCIG